MLSYSTFNQLGGKEMGGTWLSERELALVDGAEKLHLVINKKKYFIKKY